MSTTLRRRKTVASFVLGAWLFALFVAIAHACGISGATAVLPDAAATSLVGEPHDDATPACCETPCEDDVPLLTKIQPVQDPPAGTPLIPTSRCGARVLAGAALVAPPSLAAHPPSDVSIFLRFLHLAL
jgi:hypothetical protein